LSLVWSDVTRTFAAHVPEPAARRAEIVIVEVVAVLEAHNVDPGALKRDLGMIAEVRIGGAELGCSQGQNETISSVEDLDWPVGHVRQEQVRGAVAFAEFAHHAGVRQRNLQVDVGLVIELDCTGARRSAHRRTRGSRTNGARALIGVDGRRGGGRRRCRDRLCVGGRFGSRWGRCDRGGTGSRRRDRRCRRMDMRLIVKPPFLAPHCGLRRAAHTAAS
jgi:hypothetical protein